MSWPSVQSSPWPGGLGAGKPESGLQLFHKLGAEPGEGLFSPSPCFLSWKTKVEEDDLQDPFPSDHVASLSFLSRFCAAGQFSESRCLAGSMLWLSMLKTNLCPTTDLKNKAKQQATALLINSANNRGHGGRDC